jgi:NADPH:quinone reductase-like Zn-dependent oxidoreductase
MMILSFASSWPHAQNFRQSLFSDHIPTPELLRARTQQLFVWNQDGSLKVNIGGSYPLADAARAHADMVSRRTTGKLLLIP